jgi:hypothetical protein
MLSSELHDLLRPLALVQRALWWAFTLSVGPYLAIVFMLGGGVARENLPDSDLLAPILYGLSAAMAVASVAFRRWTLSKDRLQKLVAAEADPRELALDARTKQVDTDRLRRLEALSPEDRKLVRLAGSLFVSTLVSLALHEAIVIFGLVLALVGGDASAIVPFAFATVILNLFVYPRPGRIVEQAQGWIYIEAG